MVADGQLPDDVLLLPNLAHIEIGGGDDQPLDHFHGLQLVGQSFLWRGHTEVVGKRKGDVENDKRDRPIAFHRMPPAGRSTLREREELQ